MSRPTKKDWIDQVVTQQLRHKQLHANGVSDFPDQEIIFDVDGYAIDMREPKLDFHSNGNGTPHTHNDNSYPIGLKKFFWTSMRPPLLMKCGIETARVFKQPPWRFR